MPVTPTYPGVYIQEVPSGVRTITGVSTSIAAFLGRARQGPIDHPVRILSYADFVRAFGEPHAQSDLADSVRLFFVNGGTDCYVIRLAHGAQAAAVTLYTLAGHPVLTVTATAAGAWGNTVRLEVSYDTAFPDDTFHLRVIHEAGGQVVASEDHLNLTMNPLAPRFAPAFVTQSSVLVDVALDSGTWGDPSDFTTPSDYNDLANSYPGFSQSRRPLGVVADVQSTLDGLINATAPDTPRHRFEISVDESAYVPVDLAPWPTATINGATLGDIEDHFKDRIETAVGAVAPGTTVDCEFVTVGDARNMLTITATSGDQASVRVRTT